MARQPGQARLLARHFLHGLIQNDLVSPGEDLHAPIAAILAAIVSVVGLVFSILLLKYNPPRPIPLAEKLAMAVDDKVLLLGAAMIVMALVTLLAWDSLSLEPRDLAFLAPLPVPAGTLLLSKTAALAGLAAAFAVALSVAPAILFPVAMLAYATVGLDYALRSIAAEAVAGFLACSFVFLSLVALRNLAILLLPTGLARRALLAAQCVLIPALFAVLLLMPSLAMRTRPAIEAHAPAAFAWPPLWFLGVNDVLVGRDEPMIRELARAGAIAAAGVLLLGCAAYLLAFRRTLACFRGGTPATRSHRATGFVRAVTRLLVRDPLARATCAFTLATLTRSPRHRLHLVAYLGGGIALGAGSVAAVPAGSGDAMLALAPVTLAVQFNLLFFLLAGVRSAASLPADLRAAWLFRCRASGALSRYLAGTRSAVFLFGVLPLLLLLAPAHALLWGWYPAAVHAAWGLCLAAIVWAVLFRRFDRMPFACPAAPGRGRLTSRLWLYLAGYYAAVYLPAWVENAAIQRWTPAVVPAALGLGCLARLVVLEPSGPRADRLPSFDQPAGEIQQLGL